MAIEIIKAIATWSDCYKSNKPLKNPTGIVVHSTGANNPMLRRYVNSPEKLGKNIYSNYWGTGSSTEQGNRGIPHAAVGYDKDNKVAIAQVLPFTMRCWGCGSGKNGSYNVSHIQFEICEDDLTNADYFSKAFDKAAQFCAYLIKQYPTIKLENIVSHKESAAKGYASNHGDPENWLSKYGKDMSWFRNLVKKYLGSTSSSSKPSTSTTKPSTTTDKDVLYRVQVGVFSSKANAENYKKQLEAKGFNGFIVTAYNDKTKKTLYRVQVGAFSSKANAENYKKSLEKAGFDGFVVESYADKSLKVGDKVTIKKGATTYDGAKLASYVYGLTYTVIEISGDRVVIGQNGIITAAVKASNLIKK